jgi:hypothetical protein
MKSDPASLQWQDGESMSASATPKQGDHVFNAVETAILAPFETIRSLRSGFCDGQHFLHDYLLHSYSIARNIADAFTSLAARSLSASAGAEEDALREIRKLWAQYPALRRVDAQLLRDIHLQNASHFGAAVRRFEVELLKTVQQALESAVAPRAAQAAGQTPSPGIACQQMLASAYDPGSALIVVVDRMSGEATPAQSAFYPVIVGIAQTLDRPAMWSSPFDAFRESRATATGAVIGKIREVLARIEAFKAQSSVFAALVKNEIAQKGRAPGADDTFGAMVHLVHARLQQMQG